MINTQKYLPLCETRSEDGKSLWSDNESKSDDLLSHSSLSLGVAMVGAAHLSYPASSSRLSWFLKAM